MKKKTNLLVYIVLSVAVILLSVTSTLALIMDSESKTGSIIEFGKVSLCANGNKSVLGIEFDDVVSNNVDVLEEKARLIPSNAPCVLPVLLPVFPFLQKVPANG